MHFVLECIAGLIELPDIKGRYYTVQALNGWGEVTANINERNFPKHPSGKFAFCLKETKATLPKGTTPEALTMDEAKALLAARAGTPKAARRGGTTRKASKAPKASKETTKATKTKTKAASKPKAEVLS